MSRYDRRMFTVGGREYEWCGGFGAIVKSYERGVQQGDVRIIGDEMLYAYLVYRRRFRPAEVCWTLIEPTIDAIYRLHRKFFGGPIAGANAERH
jgi:hypothetical protein